MRIGMSLAMLFLCLALPGREVHVSPGGNDAGDGSSRTPWRTLRFAFGKLEPGDTCVVHPGRYDEIITSLPSGEQGKPVTIRSGKPHLAVLSALVPVSGWKRVNGDVWEARVERTLPGRNRIFIDGVPGIRARWPNRRTDDFLDWEGASHLPWKSDCRRLTCPSLPDRPDHYWKGAVLWVLAGARWTSWSVTVDDYDAAGKTLLFSLEGRKEAARAAEPYHSLSSPRGGTFYLLGGEGEIDRPGEYFVDDRKKTVRLQVDPGRDPNQMDIAMQISKDVVDTGDAVVHDLVVTGFKTVGGSISMPKCERVTLEDMRCFHLGFVDGGDTGYALGAGIGVSLGGCDSTIRDSEIAYSHGGGVVLSGHDMAIVNCDVHDIDFHASYECPVKLAKDSSRILVSHNSVHDAGRDCIQPYGSAHVIQYNDIHRMGRLCRDLGATYTVGADGEGTEYHHNWVHDNLSSGIRMGIYLDNFTQNNFIYKNAVWNCGVSGINLNRPSQNNFVINNTVIGTCKIWGRWPTDWMYNCAYVNNATDSRLMEHPQLLHRNNLVVPTGKLAPQMFAAVSEGIGKGFPVPGITGDVPYVGAYGPGETWRPGHDFSSHPHPRYRQLDTPLRTLVRNGSRPGTAPWHPVGTPGLDIRRGTGGIDKSYATRCSVLGEGCGIAGRGTGIGQTLSGFRAGRVYEFSVWYRSDGRGDLSALQLEICENGQVSAQSAVFPADGTWRQATLRAAVEAGTESLDVRIISRGDGTVWVDDAAFVGIVRGLEPRNQGLAETPSVAVPVSENIERQGR